MIRKVWCYQCEARTDHYKDQYESHGITYEEWICEDCGQEASDRSHNDTVDDYDTSFLNDDDEYGLIAKE